MRKEPTGIRFLSAVNAGGIGSSLPSIDRNRLTSNVVSLGVSQIVSNVVDVPIVYETEDSSISIDRSHNLQKDVNEHSGLRSSQNSSQYVDVPISYTTRINKHSTSGDNRSNRRVNMSRPSVNIVGSCSSIRKDHVKQKIAAANEPSIDDIRKMLSRNLLSSFDTHIHNDNFSSESEVDLDDVSDDDVGLDSDIDEDVEIFSVASEYYALGPPHEICPYCGAIMWFQERSNKKKIGEQGKFRLCCVNGEVSLPPVPQPPKYLYNLLTSDDVDSKNFRELLRAYNAGFCFSSTGAKVDNSVNSGRGPYVYRISGQLHHGIGCLLPLNDQPHFCQLYIYDTNNEVNHRISAIQPDGGGNQLRPHVIEGLLKMLNKHNKLVKLFRMARDRYVTDPESDFKLILLSSHSAIGRINNFGPSNEVAGLLVGDLDETVTSRDIIVELKGGGLKRINETFRFFMALQYPLLFPYGDEGYHDRIEIIIRDPRTKQKKRRYVTLKEYYAYILQVRPREGMTLRSGGRLYQAFIVDAYVAVEQYRLAWVKNNQTTIRSELYSCIRDAVGRGDNDPNFVGKGYILPATFTGSRRYMYEYFQDSLAICRDIGDPTIFLTMTCNPKWPEIEQMLQFTPGCRPENSPDVIARVFKLKLEQLLKDIVDNKFFGRVIGVLYVIEFQKRGLPHAHILIWLHPDDKPKNVSDIDKMVSAEIPRESDDPAAYEAVKQFMMHGPCGEQCIVDGSCGKHFPKRANAQTKVGESGFVVYQRRETDVFVMKGGSKLDNMFVVPYNRDLLVRYQCHINIEICNHARSLKYLFKYINKGYDRATMLLAKNRSAQPNQSQTESAHASTSCETKKHPVNEIEKYLDGRYICAVEACWRLFGFDIQYRSPAVYRLPVHLEDQYTVSYKSTSNLEDVASRAANTRTKLLGWFEKNHNCVEARQYTYQDFPKCFRWDKTKQVWTKRKKRKVVGRLSQVSHRSGELWYLRMLLTIVKGATSYADLRTVNGVCYGTFKEACNAMGLLKNDNEYHEAIIESAIYAMPSQLRYLFVHILCNNEVSDPLRLWANHWRCLSEDLEHKMRVSMGNMELSLSEDTVQNLCLAEIEKLLNDSGRSLKDFPQLPFPGNEYLGVGGNRLLAEELGHDISKMENEHNRMLTCLNHDQKAIYDVVTASVSSGYGGVFFVYGSGGCGKTFLWKTIIYRLRSEQKIVLPVASSGIAATLLPGGRTAHSRFRLPLILDSTSTGGIRQGSDEAELLLRTSLIIWDEAPMQHRHAFEAVDRSLRDIMSRLDPNRSKLPFGGITVLLGGDFRQILPVINKGTRADIVSASINRSTIWKDCKVFTLRQNMRLHSGNSASENRRIDDFSKWVLDIGDGKVENLLGNHMAMDPHIQIPNDFVIHSEGDHVQEIIDSTYPDLINNFRNRDYLRERAILTPTNVITDQINSIAMESIPGEEHVYLSADRIVEGPVDEDDLDVAFPVEYLNSIRLSGLPNHKITLKEGVVVMLMRNMNQTLGLCNGTRMVVSKCFRWTVLCEIITGAFAGTKHILPRIQMNPTDTKLPFDFCRTQLPLQVCFAMTINKSQGQSLERVGLYLPKSVFSHGQLYVAVSRVTSPNGLRLLIVGDDGETTTITKNIVYPEVFYDLPMVDK